MLSKDETRLANKLAKEYRNIKAKDIISMWESIKDRVARENIKTIMLQDNFQIKINKYTGKEEENKRKTLHDYIMKTLGEDLIPPDEIINYLPDWAFKPFGTSWESIFYNSKRKDLAVKKVKKEEFDQVEII